MIESVEGNINAAIFDVSVPSLGTGIEIAHTYLRPRMNLKPVPILALYEKDYWPNKLSAMITGIRRDTLPNFSLNVYKDVAEAKQAIQDFYLKIN